MTTASTPPPDELAREVNELLGQLNQGDIAITRYTASRDDRIAKLTATYAEKINPLVAERDAIMEKLMELWSQHGDELAEPGAKSAVFQNGTVSVRKAPDTLVVTDKDSVLRWLRRHGQLRRFTVVPERTINKQKLKQAEEIVANLPGAHIEQNESFIVKLARAGTELKRNRQPYTRRFIK